jgi:hypothetical protein
MPGKIVLYIRTREHLQRDTEPTEHMKESHRRTVCGYEDKLLVTTIHRWLPENEERVKKIVGDFAECHNLNLIIHDRAGFWDNLRARMKGIGTTPTVILGKNRFVGDVTAEQLEGAIQ